MKEFSQTQKNYWANYDVIQRASLWDVSELDSGPQPSRKHRWPSASHFTCVLSQEEEDPYRF